MQTLRESLTYAPIELPFGTSGLRGLATDMTDLECYINTRGFLDFLRNRGEINAQDTICFAGDLRESTPRILRAVYQAILDSDMKGDYCGLIPTPTLAYHAAQNNNACIMVTGSHIPADRNGIKFYKTNGEVMKEDEIEIKEAVSKVREEMYGLDMQLSLYTDNGNLVTPPILPESTPVAMDEYRMRYTSVFPSDCLSGKKIVFYEHSSVGRDFLSQLLESFGAEIVRVGRSNVFVPIDTENVTDHDQEYFKKLAHDYPDAFAIVSSDGDSDRPFVIDETGVFHRGDVLGALVALFLKAEFAAYPVSTNDAVDTFLAQNEIPFIHTKIGSPYVINAMQHDSSNRIVGWEVNGGFLLGTDIPLLNGTLQALPTRDAFLPIMIALLSAIDKQQKLSELFSSLPQRFTQAGLLDNFPLDISKKIVNRFSEDTQANRLELEKYFSPENGFTSITKIVTLDGVKMYFSNGDIAHIRPSGNAPQLRLYSIADTQERADEIVRIGLADMGILRMIESGIREA